MNQVALKMSLDDVRDIQLNNAMKTTKISDMRQ